MQKVTILCVGKLKEKFYADAVSEYSKRLKRHCTLEIIELTESRLPDDPSPAEIRQALAIICFAPNSAMTPAFTEKLKSNAALSSFVGSVSIVSSVVIITLLIGALGLN